MQLLGISERKFLGNTFRKVPYNMSRFYFLSCDIGSVLGTIAMYVEIADSKNSDT